MDAVAKGDMLVDIVTHHVEPVRVRKDFRVAIACTIPHDDFLILGDELAVEFCLFQRGAAHMLHR